VKAHAILNPRAGVRTPGTREAVERGRRGFRDYSFSVTQGAGHAVELARRAVADGAEAVIAVGGDGTVNEVAQALVGSQTALGIVPVGSGNGLARALRIPLLPEEALAALESAAPRQMDVGLLEERVFLNVAGVGFDAVVGHAFHDHGQRGGRRGLLSYLRMSLRELRGYRAPRLHVEVDEAPPLELEPFVLTFANGPQYGSGAVINPDAKLDDGLLEVVSFEAAPALSILAAAPRLFLGGLTRLRGFHLQPARRAVVRADSPLAVHVDGDPCPGAGPLRVAIRPLALRVLVPREPAGRPLPFTRP
jgi:YegS/Rv2252/BmrU family lipid kinase